MTNPEPKPKIGCMPRPRNGGLAKRFLSAWLMSQLNPALSIPTKEIASPEKLRMFAVAGETNASSDDRNASDPRRINALPQ